MTRTRHRAFTIVELLVVVTIIAILVAMLVPSMETAMAHAQRAACMSNEHQTANGLAGYLGDHQRVFPYGVHCDPSQVVNPNDGQPHPGWPASPPQQLLLSYTAHATKLFVCPADPLPLNFSWWKCTDAPDFGVGPNAAGRPRQGSSYMFPEDVIWGMPSYEKTVARSNQITGSPSTFGYMADGRVLVNNFTWITIDPTDPIMQAAGTGSLRIGWSHLGQVNMMFGDLSVRSEMQKELGWRVRSNPGHESVTDRSFSYNEHPSPSL